MHFRASILLALSLGFGLCACTWSSLEAADPVDPTVAAPAEPPGSGVGAQTSNAPMANGVNTGGQEPPNTDEGRANAAAPASGGKGEAPLVCPHCKSNPGGSTSDFGGSGQFAQPCPMPNRPLDAALAQRFRVDEVRASATRSFTQALSWGELGENLGLSQTWSETTIDGEITVGAFEYAPCDDTVNAAATIHFATRDGKLEDTVQGGIQVQPNALGWPADAPPVFDVGGKSDLTSARGTLELGADPSKVQLGELFVNVGGVGDRVHGGLRVRLLEYPDEAAFEAARHPTDTPGPVTVFERAAAQFPHDHCDGHGRSVAVDETVPELRGASARQLFARAEAQLGAAHAFDATWLDGSRTRAIIELDAPPERACVGVSAYDPWFVRFAAQARGHSEDGALQVAMPWFEIWIQPYSDQLARVLALGPIGEPEISNRWPGGTEAASEGWIANSASGRELAWPPCTHAETCNPENDPDNL